MIAKPRDIVDEPRVICCEDIDSKMVAERLAILGGRWVFGTQILLPLCSPCAILASSYWVN